MASRKDLHAKFCSILGTSHAYYQPPASVRMTYPAIVYSRNDIRNKFADDSIYAQSHFYEVIVIDKNPDSSIVEAVSRMPGCKFNRHYTSDNLNHDVFTIYY